MLLSPQEVRVLGVLVEKELATPGQYPLTENAVMLACNQSTGRDPVVSYDQATVRRALRSLREQGLARIVHRAGDRVEKHRHLLVESLGLGEDELALLSLLLLRGPQTIGELRTRAERLHDFADLAAVESAIERLKERPEQLVQRMERQPGQKEARFIHVLGAFGDAPVTLVGQGDPLPTDVGRSGPTLVELAEALAELQAEVRALRREVDELRAPRDGDPEDG